MRAPRAARARERRGGQRPARRRTSARRSRSRARSSTRDARRDWDAARATAATADRHARRVQRWLAQQLPVLADGVAAARIVDDARDDYGRAARRTVAAAIATPASPATACACSRASSTTRRSSRKLLAALLARREQWLRALRRADAAALRPLLEDALRGSSTTSSARWRRSLSPPCSARAARRALRHVASHASTEKLRADSRRGSRSTRAPPLRARLAARGRAPPPLLLTKEGEWRRRSSKTEGFGRRARRGRANAASDCSRALQRDEPCARRSRAVRRAPRAALHGRAMATARGAARRAVAPRRRAQGRVRGARATSTSSSSALAARRALGQRRRAVRAAARARPAHPAPARRRVPGHVAVASAAARAVDGRLGARRRPHAVPRRRSDAVDLPFPRRRHVAIPRGEAARHRRRCARAARAHA